MPTAVLSLLCLLAGVFMVPAMAPWNLWPCMFAGFSALYFLLMKAETKRWAFMYGWLFGFGYFAAGLWWIANALLVPGNEFSWVWPLAVAGLPALLAFFPALASMAVVRWGGKMKRLSGFLCFIAAFALSEWLRGHIFTGFPWNLYGYAWGGWPAMMQADALGGPYLLTLLTIGWAALPAFLWKSELTRRDKIATAACAMILFAICAIYGTARLSLASVQNHENVRVAIIQPNIRQELKWSPEMAGENLRRLLMLSDPDGAEDENTVTLILWPETAIDGSALIHPQAREMIRDMLNAYPGNAYLATGIVRSETPAEEGAQPRYFNSVMTLDKNLEVHDVYDKSHLVPFGEYIPFQEYLSLTPFVKFDGFTQGPGTRSAAVKGLPRFSSLICYEIIFPHAVTEPGVRPDFILNVTNDAWYGDSPGPRQHLMQTRFRAIEEGIAVLRAANTGISALIDPYGRIIDMAGIYEESALRTALPAALAEMPPYARLGDSLFFCLACAISIAVIILQRVKRT
ncbi:MAG TPA: apolipoprotein N-acyltransferase [Alphaproteobacteria bacterium]